MAIVSADLTVNVTAQIDDYRAAIERCIAAIAAMQQTLSVLADAIHKSGVAAEQLIHEVQVAVEHPDAIVTTFREVPPPQLEPPSAI